MPQDPFKSVVFRSLVTCDDPKGVIDCNIVLKSRISSQKMGKRIKTHRKEEQIRERFHGQSSLQLMEVYRGAEKLNQIVESLSKELKSDRKSEEIAEVLFQEASKKSVLLKKEKYQTSSSYQNEEQNFPVPFQTPKLSTSTRHSRNGADEIKEVIKDSLVTLNLNKELHFDEKNSESRSEIPSTRCSHSHSSKIRDHNVSFKGRNLIAKLMGLEEVSSTPTMQKMPNERKLKPAIDKEDQERKTLKEILETMHFKRIKESDIDREFNPHCHYSYNSCCKQSLKDLPPIVLIRPMHLSRNKTEYQARISREGGVLNEMQRLADSEFDGGLLNSSKFHRKKEEAEIPRKQVSQKKTVLQNQEVCRSRNGVIDNKKKAKDKLKEPIDKKVLMLEAAANKRPLEKERVKAKLVSRPRGREKVTSTSKTKNRTYFPCSSIPDSVSNRGVRTVFNHRDRNGQKKEKANITCTVEGKKEDGRTDFNESSQLLTKRNNTTLKALISLDKERDECDEKIIECCNESPNFVGQVSPSSTASEIDSSTAEVIDPNSHSEKDSQTCFKVTNLKPLLMRSSSFLRRVEELFDLSLYDRTKRLESSCCTAIDIANTKPLIDYAIELVTEQKCYRDSLGYMSRSRKEISVEKLVEEVCNDIESLMSDRTKWGENFFVDSLYAMLESDLWCKETMNGMWDFGWNNEFSTSKGREEMVNDLVKLILSGLVEEFFI